ncbi:hypothetical protein OCU04_002937 [Sclerotinia nivalis]|uniref:O-methyltransferase C-terminal domain-containing protein n=1 Tax=Sclerotinia nivalis TaxID=352851 RepID=A0A9X0AUN1_9HELO|nr:hypothetical protein OCU04_002937 [Sclerotinia nivalis]
MSALSPCAHVWFQQRQIGKLPPLYLSSRPSGPKLKHMEHHWNKVIQQYRDMPDADALDIIMLQEELEKGMSKEKRMAVQEYVFNVEDPERRAMLEVWLARFPGFMLRTDRLVDFGVADTRKKAVALTKSIPLSRTATFEEIAQKVGLDIVNVKRFMRHAMANRVFQEVEPNVVAHTAASKLLAEDQPMKDWVGICVEELWPAALSTIDAISQHPSASEQNQSGFCLANGTTDVEVPLRDIPSDRDNYDWAFLNSQSGTIVDVGGSHGFVCKELAKTFPSLNFIVQELSATIESAPALDASLSARITYMAHDFLNPQPVENADVYLFRWIMRNYSKKYAANILCQLKPALKKGARLLINDYCLPEAGNSSVGLEERAMRTMDINMLAMMNAQERAESDWVELFGEVKAFRFLAMKRPVGYRTSLIEAV